MMRALLALASGLLLAALLGPLGACAVLCHTSSTLKTGRYALDGYETSQYASFRANAGTGGSDASYSSFAPSDYSLTIAADRSAVEETYVDGGKTYHLVYHVTAVRRIDE